MEYSITVENVTKEYRLGSLKHETMIRDVIVDALRNPLKRMKRSENILTALNDVSFNVEKGEVVGIVGRNGAGKSTLLKVLSRITYPTRGRIRTRGRVASLIEVGTGFHDELTGRENIYLNGSILGMKKKEIDSRLDQIIDFAGVDRFIDTPIKRYSSGMRLRLGFAVAAHMDPDVLFVDEVLAVGDAEFQKRCLNAMEDLQSGGRTVLFVSHNMSAIESLCPRCLWIDAGTVRRDGVTSEVVKEYLETFSRSQQSGYDFTDHTNRSGDGRIQYTRCEFLDEAGNPTPVFRTSESFRTRLHYKVNETIKDPHFELRLLSDTGTLINALSTWQAGYHISTLEPGEGAIELEVPDFNLYPGRYYISLWITSSGGVNFDVMDHVITIDVDPPGKGEHSARGMTRKSGLVYMPQRWEMTELKESM